MESKIRKAIIKIAEKGIYPWPNPEDWVTQGIPYTLDQLHRLYPSTKPWESVTTTFRKEFGFRYVFTIDEAAKGSTPLDIEEVLRLRDELAPVQITKKKPEMSLN